MFVAASIACGAETSLPGLIAARAVQRIGAGLLGSSSLALLNHAFSEPRQRARAFGIEGGNLGFTSPVVAIGFVVGVLAGLCLLVNEADWPPAFGPFLLRARLVG